MLAIGRSLMTNPKLLLLDEATEGLAPLVRNEIWRCLNKPTREGISMLVVDKNINYLNKNDFNDVDDFKGYQVDALDNYPSFGCNIEVDYVTPETGFHEPVLNQVTNFKRITVSVNHSQLPSLVDTIIIGKGL